MRRKYASTLYYLICTSNRLNCDSPLSQMPLPLHHNNKETIKMKKSIFTLLILTAFLFISNNPLKSQNMESKISETAHKNHEFLWPGYQSRAGATDPELIQVFDNFAFDEILRHGSLDAKTRVTMIMASTIGSGSVSEYKMMVNAALNVGVTPVEVKEVLYQAVPYCGINKVIDFIYTTNEIFKERGITIPLEGQATTSPEDLMHIQRYLSANCFGDYVTRDGLDVKQRELVTLSFLIALGGTEPQMKGHITANSNVGNDRQTLIDLITQLLPYVGYPRTLNAINCLNEVLPAK